MRLHPSTGGRRHVESCDARRILSRTASPRGEAARTPCRRSLGGAARHEREAPRCRTRVIGLDAEGRQAWDRRALGEQRVCPRPDSRPLSMRRHPAQVRPRVAFISRADDLRAEDTTATNANDMQTRGDACACAALERAHDASHGARAPRSRNRGPRLGCACERLGPGACGLNACRAVPIARCICREPAAGIEQRPLLRDARLGQEPWAAGPGRDVRSLHDGRLGGLALGSAWGARHGPRQGEPRKRGRVFVSCPPAPHGAGDVRWLPQRKRGRRYMTRCVEDRGDEAKKGLRARGRKCPCCSNP